MHGIMTSCNRCSNACIGSTSRQLHHRAGGGGEHLVAAEKLSDVSALHHKAMKPDVTFKIIQKTERDKLRLRMDNSTSELVNVVELTLYKQTEPNRSSAYGHFISLE